MELVKKPEPKKPDLIVREQLAAQCVAIMTAHFTRPDVAEMREILLAAERQVAAL